MRVLVQWTCRNPSDWEEIDSADWRHLPKRPIPPPGLLGGQDNAPGWILALCVQGVVFSGHDHYAVEDIPGGCQVTTWDDDPDDPPPYPHLASRWTFLEPAPDPRFGGQINTRQWVEIWNDEPVIGEASGGPHVTHDPATFVPPGEARHGIWVTLDLLAEHDRVRTQPRWRDWIT